MIKPWIAVAAIALAATTARAAEPITPTTDKSNVIAFGAGNGSGAIEYRHLFLKSRLALIGEIAYHNQTTRSDDSSSVHYSQHATSLGLGLRQNFSTGEQLRPFVQLTVSRFHASPSGPCYGVNAWGYGASGGGEYFVGSRVSLEGSAGVSFGHSSSGCYVLPDNTQRIHTTSLDTFTTALGINFYF